MNLNLLNQVKPFKDYQGNRLPYKDSDFRNEAKRDEIFQFIEQHPLLNISLQNVCDLLGVSLSGLQELQEQTNLFLIYRQDNSGLFVNAPDDKVSCSAFYESYQALAKLKLDLQREEENNAKLRERYALYQERMNRKLEQEDFEILQEKIESIVQEYSDSWGYKFSGCTFTRPNGDKITIEPVTKVNEKKAIYLRKD